MWKKFHKQRKGGRRKQFENSKLAVDGMLLHSVNSISILLQFHQC